MKKGYLYLIVAHLTNHQFSVGDLIECLDGNADPDGCSNRITGVRPESGCYRSYNPKRTLISPYWWVSPAEVVEIGEI